MKVNGKTMWTRNPARVFRDAEMILLYRDGLTLQEIGNKFAVSREYVRQRLATFGLSAECGGRALKALLSAREAAEASAGVLAERERRMREKQGVTLSEWREIGSAARVAFQRQKQSARRRGIGWHLSLGDWWRIWQASGHWHERGRGHGYCMARWADEGPYSTENVYITTNAENVKHGYLITPASVRAEKARATREAKKFAEAA